MNIELNAIMSRFPEYRERILKQIKENEEFESLCSEYELCVDILRTIDKEAELRQSELHEYLEIKIELEQEVMKYLG